MYERLAPLAYDSLDEIAEPSEASLVIGHEEARQSLSAANKAGKLPHALILAGPRGIGKATLAFSLAASLVEPRHEMFGPRDPSSAVFRQIASGAHPGVLHLTRPFDEKAKKFKTVITADEIRRVGKFLSLRTHDAGYRIVIVDPADDMNRNAANALLKNLEEPPSRVLFILISHMPGRLLPTIRSRAQMIRLQPLDDQQLLEVLSRFDAALPIEASARTDLLGRAEGSPRTALTLVLNGGLEIAQATDALLGGTSDQSAAVRLADAVSGREASMQLAQFNETALDRLSIAAAQAARAGEGVRADALARAWAEAGRRVEETEAYNLDRKQHVLGLIDLMRRHLSA